MVISIVAALLVPVAIAEGFGQVVIGFINDLFLSVRL